MVLPDLLADNVHVKREEDLLNGLYEEAWKEANDGGQQQDSPEGQRAVGLCCVMVEHRCHGERCVDARPEEHDDGAERCKSKHDAIPPIGVDEDISIDDKDRRMRDVDTHLRSAVDIVTTFCSEGRIVEEQVCGEEADDGLIEAVEHVEPECCQ